MSYCDLLFKKSVGLFVHAYTLYISEHFQFSQKEKRRLELGLNEIYINLNAKGQN